MFSRDTEGVSAPAIPSNVLELIGNTQLVELQGFDSGPCRLFLKLESNGKQ